MPFHQPYAQKYTKGDLIYGLPEIKNKYHRAYPYFSKPSDGYPTSIDHYAFAPDEESKKCYITYEKMKKIVATHPKYNSILSSENYSFEIKNCPNKKYVAEKPLNKIRKHKAGFYIAAEQHKAGHAMQIHFLLDGLDLQQIKDKSHPEDTVYDTSKEYIMKKLFESKKNLTAEDLILCHEHPDTPVKSRFLMGACLRWLYRHRHDLHLSSIVQFWYKGKPCCPPWEQQFDFVSGQKISWILLDTYYDNSAFQAE